MLRHFAILRFPPILQNLYHSFKYCSTIFSFSTSTLRIYRSFKYCSAVSNFPVILPSPLLECCFAVFRFPTILLRLGCVLCHFDLFSVFSHPNIDVFDPERGRLGRALLRMNPPPLRGIQRKIRFSIEA